MTAPPTVPTRRFTFDAARAPDASLEWIVTNGLGGYASAPVRGGLSRRFHGLLVASLPEPLGRILCLSHLRLSLLVDGRRVWIDHEDARVVESDPTQLTAFALEGGLPSWRYESAGAILERRICMPYGRNTTHVWWRLGGQPATLRIQPAFDVRKHGGRVDHDAAAASRIAADGEAIEFAFGEGLPAVRLRIDGARVSPALDHPEWLPVEFPIERSRGYDHAGRLWTPGWIDIDCTPDGLAAVSISTEPWDAIPAQSAADDLAREAARRETLLEIAGAPADPIVAELTLAADQFVTVPVQRAAEVARARAAGDEPRTVIAGYHWFTDWGRDSMISLDGLFLATGRAREAGCLLRTFAQYIRDGLIPNMFPEGQHVGLYNTADATLWFFHAVHRYVEHSGDRATLSQLLPSLVEIAERHVGGTRFGIGVDPADGLLRQGAEGYQLTWMDAKVGDWVVTPRRGKAVEINALWYNAQRLLADWLGHSGRDADAAAWRNAAARTQESFNRRFWNHKAGFLFDVVDGEHGDDDACRPNQVLAISLDHPVLDPSRWAAVVSVVAERLLTPAGLRTLDVNHPDYKPVYDGDLHARDAAYHQGTVWPWLIGPFIDAWLRAHPEDLDAARRALAGFPDQLSRAGTGTISEIFDAEPPFTARGCIAQAWSVAEVLRAWRRVWHVAPPGPQSPAS